MNPERWERIQAVFHEALERPPAERRQFVLSSAGGDAELANEVLALVAEDEHEDSLLDRGLDPIAAGVLAGDAHPPRQVGHYQLGAMLGEGGMGVVYGATRPDLGQRVAIKILRDAWLSPVRRERFAIEQTMLARLEHPSIARLLDADTLPDGTPWFAMEYVDGEPLTRFCAAQGLSIRARVGLVREVCEAVQHAHEHAVMHRDLKPSNILVTREGRPKLLDFGIAKSLEAVESGVQRTRTELRLMTPAYAAPEQFIGEGQGVHTDVYALGVVLYELLTGRVPIELEGRTPTEQATMVLHQEPEKPSVVARRGGVATAERGVSWSDLDVICLTALQKDPARRYRSVESLVRDLDHYLRGEPLEARPDTIGYRTNKFVRRNWQPLAVAAAVVIAVAALVTTYTLRLRSARNEALAEARRTRRIQGFMNELLTGSDADADRARRGSPSDPEPPLEADAGPSDTLRVVDVLERGAKRASHLDAEPAIQGELYQTIGAMFRVLGRTAEADSMLSAALRVRQSRLGQGHPDVARSLVALGQLRVDQLRLDEAERLIRQGLELSRRRASEDPEAVARGTAALGNVLVAREDYARGIPLIEEAVQLDSVAGLSERERSKTLTDLANAHYYAGHVGAADSISRQVLAVDRRLNGDRHPSVASDLVNLGYFARDSGRQAEAERQFREAYDIYRGWWGDDHPATASALSALGGVLVVEDKLDEARVVLNHALAIRERILGPSHALVANTLNDVALLAEKQERWVDAEAAYRRQIAIYRAAFHDHYSWIGVAWANLGTMEYHRKRFVEAERCLREALKSYAGTLPADHLNVGIAHFKLGRILLKMNRSAEAEAESRIGYDILMRADPQGVWVDPVRTDLAAEYQALGRPAEAAKYRTLATDSVGKPAPVATR
jgi:serine/threonine-protein kinase